MANFPTHIAVGTVVSGLAATLTLAADVIAAESLVAVTLAGVVGSVLPDIDLKDSRPSRALFAGLAVFFSFCVLFVTAPKYSIAEMWVAWLGTLFAVRYIGQKAFSKFSYHRGIWHSLVAGLFFWFLTAVIFRHLLGFHEGVAWLGGGFVFLGYLTHLILDEVYSVDVSETRIKRSFGTALKVYDSKRLGESALVAGLAVLTFMVTPPAKVFIDGVTSQQLWAGLHSRLLPPHGHWFGIDVQQQRSALGFGKAPATSDVTTGSLPERPAATPVNPVQPAAEAVKKSD
jgi:LexA-binding, inner membrane-associated putative hydrolase